jgi:hypothetical protein
VTEAARVYLSSGTAVVAPRAEITVGTDEEQARDLAVLLIDESNRRLGARPWQNGLGLLQTSLIVLIVAMVIASAVFQLRGDDEERVSAAEAKAAALSWVGAGEAQAPRRDGDVWEVDVVRPNGSLVQVTLGDRLELRGFDEEFGPGHSPAPDELRGAARARAIEAAFRHVGPGRVIGVERESSREVDVDMRIGGDRIEVRLNPRLRVIEVKPEDPGDD